MEDTKMYLDLQEIFALGYGRSNNTIYIPNSNTKGEIIDHEIKLQVYNNRGQIESSLRWASVSSAFFFNSLTGARFDLKAPRYVWTGDGRIELVLEIDKESYENSNSDKIGIEFYTDLSSKIEAMFDIKVTNLRSTSKAFSFKTNAVKIKEVNLLNVRNKIGSAAWSSVYKNTNSITSKVLEPLNSHFTSVFNKSNEYLRQTFLQGYSPGQYARVFTSGYPSAIYRDLGLYERKELTETVDRYSSFQPLLLERNYDTSGNLFDFLVENTKNKDLYLKSLNFEIKKGSQLYVTNIKSNLDMYQEVVIQGRDERGRLIGESLIIRKGMYSRLQNRYYKILSISSPFPFLLSNYVDLRYSHYIDMEPYISPAISDSYFQIFKPYVETKINGELDSNFINLSNNDSFDEGGYNFYIKDKLISYYIDDKLNITFLVKKEKGLELCQGILNIDLSKPFDNPSTNNNNIIMLSNTKTLVNDWVDVWVNIEEYLKETKSDSFYIEIKNREKVMYFNPEKNTLEEEKLYLYPSQLETDLVEFTIYIENSDPYIFSIKDDKTSNKIFTAMTEVEEVKPYKVENLESYFENTEDLYLIMHNDQIIFQEDFTESIKEEADEDNLLLVEFTYSFIYDLKYYIEIEEDKITKDFTTLPQGFCKLISIPEKGRDFVSLDLRKLKRRYGEKVKIKIGVYSDLNNNLPFKEEIIPETFVSLYLEGRKHIEENIDLVESITAVEPCKLTYIIDLQDLTIDEE